MECLKIKKSSEVRVNSREAIERANFVLLQLHIASQCGITIPTTLCSMDQDEIKKFYSDHEGIRVICKPLWLNGSHSNRLQLFQTEVQAVARVRVTCQGSCLAAVNVQQMRTSFVLPEDLANKIRQFMHEMGLVSGMLDLIVTPDYDYVFLEMNASESQPVNHPASTQHNEQQQ